MHETIALAIVAALAGRAAAGDALFLRTDSHLYRIEEKAPRPVE